jgi:hypothetical protein
VGQEAIRPSRVNGRWRTRCPPSLTMALATAGASDTDAGCVHSRYGFARRRQVNIVPTVRLDRHAARDFDALGIDPTIVLR